MSVNLSLISQLTINMASVECFIDFVEFEISILVGLHNLFLFTGFLMILEPPSRNFLNS